MPTLLAGAATVETDIPETVFLTKNPNLSSWSGICPGLKLTCVGLLVSEVLERCLQNAPVPLPTLQCETCFTPLGS